MNYNSLISNYNELQNEKKIHICFAFKKEEN